MHKPVCQKQKKLEITNLFCLAFFSMPYLKNKNVRPNLLFFKLLPVLLVQCDHIVVCYLCLYELISRSVAHPTQFPTHML